MDGFSASHPQLSPDGQTLCKNGTEAVQMSARHASAAFRTAETNPDQRRFECLLRRMKHSWLAPQRRAASGPWWHSLTCNFEVFGSFPGLYLTGEMRTPLRKTDRNFSWLIFWVLVVITRPDRSISNAMRRTRH